MRKKLLFPAAILTVFFIFLAASEPVFCQGTTDLIGIYTADDGTGVSHLEVAPGPNNLVKAYLCITGCSDKSGVSGWECTLSGMEIPDGVVVTEWDLTWGQGSPYPPLNIDTPPNFAVGIGTNHPIPWSDCICLVSFTFFVQDANPKFFYIHPYKYPSIPDHPVYAAGNNAGKLVALDWACGGEAYPAFVVNGFTDPLNVENHVISRSEGGEVDFVLNAGSRYGGRRYFLEGSSTGTSPGIPLPGGAVLPLTWDFVTRYIFNNYNNTMLRDFRGRLDGDGGARAVLFKDGPFPLAAGTTLYFAYTTEVPYDFQSNVVTIEVVP